MTWIKRQLRRLRDDLIGLYRASSLYKWTTGLSVLFLALTLALPLWRLVPYLPEGQFIPLHYNIYFGVDRFGPWYHLFFLPALGAVLLIINIIFEALFFEREHVLSTFFAAATLFAEIVLFTAMVFIVLLNV